MGSFRASLNAFGEDVDVLYANFQFRREVDKQGRVSSSVYGGDVTVRVPSTESTKALEAMTNNQFKPFDATITFKKTDEDSKLKELQIKNAYVVGYKEMLDVTGEQPMTTLLTFSAETLEMGAAVHDNRWPKGS